MVFDGESEYCNCTGESVDESSEENWELNDGFLFFRECREVRVVCWVIGGLVDRRVCWICLFDRVARLEALGAVAVFASCRAIGLVLFLVLVFT